MANTPFLDLVKPAGTDRALVSVINSNSDKIDSGVSTLSEQIATKDFDSDTLANVQTAIYNYVANMADGEQKSIRFGISSASGVFAATTYVGKLMRNSRTRFNISAQQSINNTRLILGRYKDGTWYWEQTASTDDVSVINDELGGTKFLTFNVNNSSVTIDLSNGFRGVLFSSSAYSSEEGIYSVRTSSAGGVSMGTFFASSGLTFNTSENNKLTISSTRYVEFTLTIMNGTASK